MKSQIGKSQRMPESFDEQRTDEKNHSESSTSVTSSINTVSTYHRTVTQEETQLLHPLELNDKLAFETIKTVRLDFLTDEAVPPIPRCQALPSHAFSRLTGRSILVALSHGWFFQTHPDPDGAKLDLIKNRFAPELRERYPNTDIQVFFDYLASPQRPRTTEEDKIFAIAMDRMNSMYVYADVIVFLEVDLPTIDMTVHTSDVDLSKYKFFDFVDTIQVSETTSKQGPQQFDCIQTCDSNQVTSSEQLHKLTSIHTLTYLHRPFGRPNTIINDDRGWLFLERITIAIKAAAAEKAQFDDIVVSNSEKLRLQIYKWCERLRDAASKQSSEPQALPDLLNHFDNELRSKRFSFSSDEDVVRGLMKKLVNQFANDWKGEVEKQKSMSKRAKEILLRWGEFSEQYVERAGFLRKESETWIEISRTVWRMFLLLFCPTFMLYLFTFDVLEDPVEDTYVSRWESVDEYNQTMTYMGIDLGVEFSVFALTIVTLKTILPDISAWRVLFGLLKMHAFPMAISMCGVWYCALLFQSTQFGMDTTFRFSWLKCDGKENSTWLGGFDWEC